MPLPLYYNSITKPGQPGQTTNHRYYFLHRCPKKFAKSGQYKAISIRIEDRKGELLHKGVLHCTVTNHRCNAIYRRKWESLSQCDCSAAYIPFENVIVYFEECNVFVSP